MTPWKPIDAAVQSVADMRWQRRVLLLSANSHADLQLLEQERETTNWVGAADRDVTVVQIVDDEVQGASDPAAGLRKRFDLPADGFMVVLLGKDGHVALRSTRPISAATLAGTIDAMPMRKAELAARQDEPMGSHPTREQLIGAWRLVSIESATPGGAVVDPFFEKGSAGFIVYDASGWMSVQISGPHRMPPHRVPPHRVPPYSAWWKIPASRSPATLDQNLRLKAAAYDSYYAYYGTWDYDPVTAVMTHHVKSSVIPVESGLDYAQRISVTGNRMTFTGHAEDDGHPLTRTKIWERVSGP